MKKIGFKIDDLDCFKAYLEDSFNEGAEKIDTLVNASMALGANPSVIDNINDKIEYETNKMENIASMYHKLPKSKPKYTYSRLPSI